MIAPLLITELLTCNPPHWPHFGTVVPLFETEVVRVVVAKVVDGIGVGFVREVVMLVEDVPGCGWVPGSPSGRPGSPVFFLLVWASVIKEFIRLTPINLFWSSLWKSASIISTGRLIGYTCCSTILITIAIIVHGTLQCIIFPSEDVISMSSRSASIQSARITQNKPSNTYPRFML